MDWVPRRVLWVKNKMLKTDHIPYVANDPDLIWAADRNQHWATRLIDIMSEMGGHHTNAVLLSLEGATPVKAFKHYPEKPCFFGNQHWRAFYHCHDDPNGHRQEHGHFHFFTNAGPEQDWAHVVALGMDDMGQPTRFFTTNLWVTDGIWFDAKHLMEQMKKLSISQENDLAPGWFKYMLLCYRETIQKLLLARDQQVESLHPGNHEQCYRNRAIYYLSETGIILNEKLQDILSPDSEPG